MERLVVSGSHVKFLLYKNQLLSLICPSKHVKNEKVLPDVVECSSSSRFEGEIVHGMSLLCMFFLLKRKKNLI